MTKFVDTSMNLLSKGPQQHQTNTYRVPVLLFVALLGYIMPWVTPPPTSLSLGAYDLAEWASLNPSVQQTTPFLWAALALRIPLAALSLLIVIYLTHRNQRFLGFAALILAVIALLPPLEFFTTYRNDANYLQQFILAMCTLVIGIILLRLQSGSSIKLIFIFSTLGCFSSGIGLYQSQLLMNQFKLPVYIGWGGIITILSLGIIAALTITKQSSP